MGMSKPVMLDSVSNSAGGIFRTSARPTLNQPSLRVCINVHTAEEEEEGQEEKEKEGEGEEDEEEEDEEEEGEEREERKPQSNLGSSACSERPCWSPFDDAELAKLAEFIDDGLLSKVRRCSLSRWNPI